MGDGKHRHLLKPSTGAFHEHRIDPVLGPGHRHRRSRRSRYLVGQDPGHRPLHPGRAGGTGGTGTNPEQLFAAGYSACFLGALKYVAGQENIAIADNASVTGRVGIGAVSTGFAIDVALTISLPGVPTVQAEDLVRKAHIVCPYSHATRNNINVALIVA